MVSCDNKNAYLTTFVDLYADSSNGLNVMTNEKECRDDSKGYICNQYVLEKNSCSPAFNFSNYTVYGYMRECSDPFYTYSTNNNNSTNNNTALIIGITISLVVLSVIIIILYFYYYKKKRKIPHNITTNLDSETTQPKIEVKEVNTTLNQPVMYDPPPKSVEQNQQITTVWLKKSILASIYHKMIEKLIEFHDRCV
jgi:hypothetical protein